MGLEIHFPDAVLQGVIRFPGSLQKVGTCMRQTDYIDHGGSQSVASGRNWLSGSTVKRKRVPGPLFGVGTVLGKIENKMNLVSVRSSATPTPGHYGPGAYHSTHPSSLEFPGRRTNTESDS